MSGSGAGQERNTAWSPAGTEMQLRRGLSCLVLALRTPWNRGAHLLRGRQPADPDNVLVARRTDAQAPCHALSVDVL